MPMLARWLSPVFLLLSLFVFSFGALAQTIDDFGFEPPLYFLYIGLARSGAGATHPVALGGNGNIQTTKDGAMSRTKEQCEVVWPSNGYHTNWTEEEIVPGWRWRGSCRRTDEGNVELFYGYVDKFGVCSAEAPYDYGYDYLNAVTVTESGFGWIACGYLKSARRLTGGQSPCCGNPIFHPFSPLLQQPAQRVTARCMDAHLSTFPADINDRPDQTERLSGERRRH
jgi:hypothetical protein